MWDPENIDFTKFLGEGENERGMHQLKTYEDHNMKIFEEFVGI